MQIDGLAPVRTSRQEQNYSSIVSTLLALLDGLDSRGDVVVIGATVSRSLDFAFILLAPHHSFRLVTLVSFSSFLLPEPD